MSLVDMMLGHQALERMGYSPELIRRVLSREVFQTVSEMYAALDKERELEMGAKRPEPPPPHEPYDGVRPTSPPPPPKKYEPTELESSLNRENQRLLRELEAVEKRLAVIDAAAKSEAKERKCPVCKAPSDQHSGGSPEIALLQQNLAYEKDSAAAAEERVRELLDVIRKADDVLRRPGYCPVAREYAIDFLSRALRQIE